MHNKSDPVVEHHIQLQILKVLVTCAQARYSELKPNSVEANLFMYHLNQLLKAKLVEKTDKSYALTRRGKHFADRANLGSMTVRMQPKCITILAIQRAPDSWLILKRKHQPFIGYKGFPSGKVQYGETMQAAAKRMLYSKSGLSNIDLTLRGNVIMRFTDELETINHITGYVYHGSVPITTEVSFDHQHFESYFAPESEFFVAPSFEGHHQILELLKGSSPFIAEFEFKSSY